MSSVCRLRASVVMAALCAAVAGCAATPPPVQYHNVDHPNYSSADFNRDNTQCRDQNSTKQVIPGYEDKLVVTVDEPKAKACLAAKGWQPN
jgi:ABC-type uncharacterized transport system auxiliary subunit